MWVVRDISYDDVGMGERIILLRSLYKNQDSSKLIFFNRRRWFFLPWDWDLDFVSGFLWLKSGFWWRGR